LNRSTHLSDGGAGNDTAMYDTSSAGVQVNLAIGTGLGGDAQGDVLAAIENVVGSNFADLLIGDGNATRPHYVPERRRDRPDRFHLLVIVPRLTAASQTRRAARWAALPLSGRGPACRT
jgi:hypothetical protein